MLLENIFIEGAHFSSNIAQEKIFRQMYDKLEFDPYANGKIRKRAYRRYTFTAEKGLVESNNSTYFQTYDSNNVDGGKDRDFIDIPDEIINNNLFKKILSIDTEHIIKKTNLHQFDIGVHPIRYVATEKKPSYSSPLWLHKDDEELVFLHFLSKSENAVGGDSIISNDGKSINLVKNLSTFMDTIVLTKEFFHAVTPLGCNQPDSTSYRDILLVTLESRAQKK
ncbi:2OG-Fe dioxygenase family protein [Pectobacterium sp. A5351]|uniref:2OG-Fe dioxygenase family protein n=1 Tax=Pectobacterium sp. A5351 TaxID=2914983 RepID=UPI00232C8AC6|nr:2OG-Fe dioxygenase family protein [Pectobacterium sp. A5351]WCG82295.1 2OG-Fe dioxygenase family protein [Pectobacterium sp. A5351]